MVPKEDKLRLMETYNKGRENENRLTILETKFPAILEKLDSIDKKLDGFCNPTDGVFVIMSKKATDNQNSIDVNTEKINTLFHMTNAQWVFISGLVLTIIGAIIYLIKGH